MAVLTVSIGRSSSPVFAEAVELLRAAPTYQASGQGATLRHNASFPLTTDTLPSVLDILRDVHGWRSSRISVDGEPTRGLSLFWVLSCAQHARLTFPHDPAIYCRSGDYGPLFAWVQVPVVPCQKVRGYLHSVHWSDETRRSDQILAGLSKSAARWCPLLDLRMFWLELAASSPRRKGEGRYLRLSDGEPIE